MLSCLCSEEWACLGWFFLGPDSYSFFCSPNWVPFFFLPQEPASWPTACSLDERPVLKSVHVGPVNIQAQENRLPLSRTALLINHASGSGRFVHRTPMKTSEGKQHFPCPLQESQDVSLLKAQSKHTNRQNSAQGLLLTEVKSHLRHHMQGTQYRNCRHGHSAVWLRFSLWIREIKEKKKQAGHGQGYRAEKREITEDSKRASDRMERASGSRQGL